MWLLAIGLDGAGLGTEEGAPSDLRPLCFLTHLISRHVLQESRMHGCVLSPAGTWGPTAGVLCADLRPQIQVLKKYPFLYFLEIKLNLTHRPRFASSVGEPVSHDWGTQLSYA